MREFWPSTTRQLATFNTARRQAVKRVGAWLALPFLPACGGGGGGGGGSAGNPGSTSQVPWADDFQTFATNVRATHPDPAGITRGAAWQSLLTQLTASAGQKSDKANLVDAMKLAALMKDEHTRVNSNVAFAQTAIRFATAADGVWVQQIASPNSALLGARLLAIDGIAMADASERIKAVISAATAAAYANQTPPLLHQTELLWLAGIGAASTQSTFTLRDVAGIERSLVLAAGDPSPLDNIYGRPGGPVAPLWLSQLDRNYFFTTLAGSACVYVRYARCAADALTSPAAFFSGISQALAALPTPRLIFDLRNNPGGDSSILTDAIRQGIGGGAPAADMRIAVLVNGGTYSSATINLYDLLRVGAKSFGEPPGTAPNHTGEAKNFVLPRTGTGYTSSSRVFTLDAALGANNYAPDVLVAPTIEDRANGRDPVLARAEQFVRTGN